MSFLKEDFPNKSTYEFIPYRAGTLWGFSDIWGEILIEPQYDEVEFFCCVDEFDPEYRAIVRRGEHYYIIDKENTVYYMSSREVILIDSMIGYQFHRIEIEDKQGVFFKDSILIPVIYDYINGSYEDVFIASKGGKYGRIDYQGNIIIPIKYDEINEIEDEEQKVIKQWKAISGNKTIYYSMPLAEIVTTNKVFSEVLEGGIKILPFEEELNYIYDEKGKVGIEILKRNIVIPPIYDDIRPLDSIIGGKKIVVEVEKGNHIFIVKKNSKYGMINETQDILLPINLDNIKIRNFKSYSIYRDGKMGIYNINNNTVITPQYDNIMSWVHCVKLNDKHNFYIYKITEGRKTSYIGENNMCYYED